MRRPLASTILAALAVASACAPGPAPESARAHGSPLTHDADLASFYVVLDGPPAVSRIPHGVDPRSAEAGKATRARLAEIEVEQAALEPALVEHGARVIARLTRLANAIQILADATTADRVSHLPGVRRVERVPLAERSLASAVPVVGAPAVWAGPLQIQGDGITIGIIDSGIDYTHADFGGAGTPDAYLANDPKIIEPGSFPTAKVVGGWDFVGDDYNPTAGVNAPHPDADPLDCTKPESDQISGGHGTHVSGIAAGNGVTQAGVPFDGPYQASVDPTAFRVAPGVAPRASLFALKVFGCDGSTTMLGAALDRAADPNNDGAFDDRLDVVNASLGTGYGLGSPTTAQLVSNLTEVGTLIVAAAGNDGQSFFTTSSPGSYPEVLSVAASADNEFLALSVTAPASATAVYAAAEGGFTTLFSSVGPLSGEVVAASPALGCSPFTNAAAVAGKIALIDRGSCAFIDKFTNAVAAGALAGVIVDNEDDPLPFAMGGGDPGTITIPGVLVRQADGASIKAALVQAPVTVALDPLDKFVGVGAELLAGFSARGPSPTDGRLKPEIAAPGFSIDSARVGSGTEARRSQGTSMASPMVAGGAALVRQAQPGFSPLEVKAALVNGAAMLVDLSDQRYGTSVVGGGRMDVERSVSLQVTAAAHKDTGEIGVSFGALVADEPASVQRPFEVTNHGATAVQLHAAIDPTYALPGVLVTVAPADVALAAGETASLELTLSLDPAALGSPGPDPGTPAVQGGQNPTPRHYLNEANGVVRFTEAGSSEELVLPYNGSVRAAMRRKGKPPSACVASRAAPEDPVEVTLVGGGAHPAPVVTAFQLGALDEENPDSATDPIVALNDVRAVGVATDLATAASFAEAQVFFGIAISGTWTTPARGPLSVVAVEINADRQGSAEHSIRAEARNANPPFRDALTAATYDLATDQRISRRPINIVAPDVALTNPFHSSVIVLSGLLSELDIDPENPVFDYTVITESPDLLTAGEKVKGTFDAGKPVLDPAAHGLDGAPLFIGAGPVLVDVSPEARASQAPLDLLLLHHTNVPGQQWEVVSLVPGTRGNLVLSASAPATIDASATGVVAILVTNGGGEAAPNVKLGASAVGGEVVSAEAGQGSCTAGATLDCALGELAPGASVAVNVTVRGAAGSGSVALDASVQSDLECETSVDDNAALASIQVLAGPPVAPKADEPPALRADGGCGCRVGEGSETEGACGAWLLAAFGWLVVRRRRGSPKRR